VDAFTVNIIVISTGERFILEGVTAEVEHIHETTRALSPVGSMTKQIVPNKSHLDIVLEVYDPDTAKYNLFNQMVTSEELLLSFKDIHPCLIKGYVKSMTQDFQKITIRFTGNTIDKTFNDYMDGLNDTLKQKIGISDSEKTTFYTAKPKETKIPKRKLTF
jgi:hypothetical protein